MRKLLIPLFAIGCNAAFAQSYVPEKNNKLVKVSPVTAVKAYAFNLGDIKLLAGSPFKNAMDKDAAYLLELKPDRLLHRFYDHANLPVKDSVYGGWESEGLSGHTLGHYLSACAMMYAGTDDNKFKQRVDHIVNELEKCQKARNTGYIGAIPKEDSIFGKVAKGEIRSTGFDLNGGWSPWYTVHKVMAGLCDAYLYAENKKALSLVKKMADWVYNTVNHLDDSTRLKMLNCEYGGMNEVLANIYSFTGNKKYLALSYKFYDEFVMGQLAKQIDPMPGKHSNTNVPKAIGSARQFELTGNKRDSTIASFFWTTMVDHHSYVIGGNSNYEYCGKPDSLNDRLSDNTSETCNTYNMLKLTRHLFALEPSGRQMDYYERALYNHILASQNPAHGMMCYFVPLRMGAKKQYSEKFNTFTCCVGSGMENHSKYAEQIYSHDGQGIIFVNLFIPSELNWQEQKIRLRQETNFPETNTTSLVYLGEETKTLNLRIRQPAWSTGGLRFFVDGKEINDEIGAVGQPPQDKVPGYIPVRIRMQKGGRLEIRFNMELHMETMPDNPDRVAFKYGPVVLAGQLGREMPDPVFGAPVLLTDNRDIKDWIKPVAGSPLTFELENVGKPVDVKLAPFYKTHEEYYSVYWDFFTHREWSERQEAWLAEKKKQKELDDRTIDIMRLGEMQPERDHNLKASDQSYTEIALGRGGREVRNGGFFSFEMKVLPGVESVLLLSYLGDDKGRVFDILVDGVKIATQELKGAGPGRFFDVEYPIPQELLAGKTRIEVKIQAHPRRTAGRVFSPRILRK